MKKNSAFSLVELSIVILIIGILVAGITQGSRMVQQSRLSTARSITQSSDINSIKDMVLWLDATSENNLTNSLGSKVLENNDPIQTWMDQSSQGFSKFSFSQATSNKRPTYIEKGINSLPTLFFNATSNASSGNVLATPFSVILNPTELTIFAVAQPIEQTTGWGTIFSTRNIATPYIGINVYKNISGNNWEAWTGNGSAWITTADSAFSFNTPYVISTVRDSTNTTLFRNGTQKDTDICTFIANSDSTSSFQIGAGGSSSNPAYYFDGYISEIIMFDRALKTEERQMVEKYLGKKYGIKIS